jgi:NAD-dependent SIR2 family protein deacetylase
VTERSVAQLNAFLAGKSRLTVLTGAGISTASGIPTYRDKAGEWQRSTPIQHQDFLQQPQTRQRYWLRSYSGWPAVSRAQPNEAHRALANLEARGTCRLLVTQNVDRLHQKAGSQQVIDLHGRLDQVICLQCQRREDRDQLQARLKALNPFLEEAGTMAPDGDADVEENQVPHITVPDCESCAGILKPEVVFFGGNVDRAIVQQIYDELDEADGLLIVGSSLKVFSGYRFCRYAAERGLPIASINPGVTRADPLIQTKIQAEASAVLASAC